MSCDQPSSTVTAQKRGSVCRASARRRRSPPRGTIELRGRSSPHSRRVLNSQLAHRGRVGLRIG